MLNTEKPNVRTIEYLSDVQLYFVHCPNRKHHSSTWKRWT